MLALPNQTPNLKEQYGLTRAEVDRAAWVIEPGGRKFAGAAAINRVLQTFGGGWSLFARLYSFPPLQWVEDQVYRWVAEHRHQLARFYSATPECEQPGVTCE